MYLSILQALNVKDFYSHIPSVLSSRRRMSLPTLPTSEHDIVVPLPGQASIDSRLKHLRAQRKAQQKTPSGLVVDPVELLRCIGGSDSSFSTHNSTTYSHHSTQSVTLESSSSTTPVCSTPKFSIGGGHSPNDDIADENKRVVEHIEVDPHARGVQVFRRNSLRKFSALSEESEDKETSSFPPPTGGPQTVFTNPLFVISDGIRQTYFPGLPSRTQLDDIAETTDPVAVYEHISSQTFLRKHPSHPELSSLGEPFPRPFKVPASPDLNANRRSISIFSPFAGELRSQVRATVPQSPTDHSPVAIPDAKTIDQSENQYLKLAESPQSPLSPQTSPFKVEIDNFDISHTDIPDGRPKKKSMMESLIKWGTESRVKVSDKETNMYSPGSF